MSPLATVFLVVFTMESTLALEKEMAEMINIEREARGLTPLRLDADLSDAARAYSEKMATADEVNHRLGRPMEERIGDALPGTCLFGENVSKHTNIDYSLGDLMLSEGHRENLLHRDYTVLGIGIVRGEGDYLYITQEFARPCERRRRTR